MLSWQRQCEGHRPDDHPRMVDLDTTKNDPAMRSFAQLWPRVGGGRGWRADAGFPITSEPYVYMGRLYNARGERLVIVLRVFSNDAETQDALCPGPPWFLSVVIQPGGWMTGPTLAKSEDVKVFPEVGGNSMGSTPVPLLVGTGRRDPAHADRFIVPFSFGSTTSEFHGTLKDDDTVEMRDASANQAWIRYCKTFDSMPAV